MRIFLDDAVPKGLIEVIAINPFKNILLLKLSSAWSELSPEQKETGAQYSQVQAIERGSAELELKDDDGHLLARTSRVGSGMITFKLGSD